MIYGMFQIELRTEIAAFLMEACPFADAQEAAGALARCLALVSGASSVGMEPRKDELSFVQETKGFGSVDIIFETKLFGVYRLNIAPGKGIPLHFHEQMKEAEFVLTDGLALQGVVVPRGTRSYWKHGERHRYDNGTAQWQAVLCVDSPPFIPEDEIEVPAP